MIAGSQTIAEVCFHMIADDRRTFCDPRSSAIIWKPALKLVFSLLVKGIKIKIFAKLRASRRLRFEDAKSHLKCFRKVSTKGPEMTTIKLRGQTYVFRKKNWITSDSVENDRQRAYYICIASNNLLIDDWRLLFFLSQVMERAVFHSDNCYLIPNIRLRGYVCKTNIPSNTAFRGFGGPQVCGMCMHGMSIHACMCIHTCCICIHACACMYGMCMRVT